MTSNNNLIVPVVPEMPFSLADENYIISQMYYVVDRAERILYLVDKEDFYNPLNKSVFLIASKLTDMGEVVTSRSISEEYFRQFQSRGETIPFDAPGFAELQGRYQAEAQVIDAEGLPGAVRRVKEDRQYREIIYTAQDALLMARSREGKPGDIITSLDSLSHDLQKAGASKITWAKEAERDAQERYDAMDRGESQAIPTFYPEIDEHLQGGGDNPGDYVVTSGVTSGGKTTFALNASRRAAENGIPNLYFTAEMETFLVFSRQLASVSKVPGYKMRSYMTEKYGEHVREKLRASGLKMSGLPIGYLDKVRDMATVRRITKFAVREHGVRKITLDYLGKFAPYKGFRGTATEKASVTSELCKELATELGIVVDALVQLRRKSSGEKGNDKDGNDVEPTLDMLKNSGDIENDADTVRFLWGEKGKEGDKEAVRYIHGRIAKARNGVLAPFELVFAPAIYHFSGAGELSNLRSKIKEVSF